jgi:hypothetical protein
VTLQEKAGSPREKKRKANSARAAMAVAKIQSPLCTFGGAFESSDGSGVSKERERERETTNRPCDRQADIQQMERKRIRNKETHTKGDES